MIVSHNIWKKKGVEVVCVCVCGKESYLLNCIDWYDEIDEENSADGEVQEQVFAESLGESERVYRPKEVISMLRRAKANTIL